MVKVTIDATPEELASMGLIKQEVSVKEKSKEEFDKGYAFEKYVINHFIGNNKPNKKYFEVEEWTRDIDKNRTGVEVNSNKNPDIVFIYNGKDSIAVECKFRAGFYKSKSSGQIVLKWSYPEQIDRYKNYQQKKNIPVFVVIGVGNNIEKGEVPKKMYCIPLDDAKHPELFLSYLKKYERNPDDLFYWNSKEKSLK